MAQVEILGYNQAEGVTMAVRQLEVPAVLRRAWGDEAADAFAVWLTSVLEERAISRDEYRQILSRLDILEHDMADLKADVQELRREIDERFDRLHREMNERFDRMNERFDQMYHQMVVQTRWFIGALVVIGTVISTLLAIAQFVR
jgi:septal ring factor EnvC (AmiA/AmiB activator)